MVDSKQKLCTSVSTEAELVSVDDAPVYINIEWKGYNIEKNIMYQDNKSEILLEVNGKSISGNRIRALDISYFYDRSS